MSASKNVGERNANAKLREIQVMAFRERHAAGEKIVALAREYGVTSSTGTLLVTGRIWRRVGGPIRETRPHRLGVADGLDCPACGSALEYGTDGLGVMRTRCLPCERRQAGRCMDCGGAVVGRSWRCERHQADRRDHYWKTYQKRHRPELRTAALRYIHRLSPAERRQRNAYQKAWRQQNPRKVYAQKRRARLRGCGGYATREKYLAYHRAYRERQKSRQAVA